MSNNNINTMRDNHHNYCTKKCNNSKTVCMHNSLPINTVLSVTIIMMIMTIINNNIRENSSISIITITILTFISIPILTTMT